MSITAKRFQEFTELALAAFNSQKVIIVSLTEQLGTCPAQLTEALANDVADKAAIEEAKEKEATVRNSLEALTAQSEADTQALLSRIAKLESDLGIVLSVPISD